MLNAENAEAIKAEFKDDPQFALDAILAGKTLVEAKSGLRGQAACPNQRTEARGPEACCQSS